MCNQTNILVDYAHIVSMNENNTFVNDAIINTCNL
jgi:hypothetical protein